MAGLAAGSLVSGVATAAPSAAAQTSTANAATDNGPGAEHEQAAKQAELWDRLPAAVQRRSFNAVDAARKSTGRGEISAGNRREQQLALMKFNGYYSLSNAPGAYFYIDTNIYVASSKSNTVVSLRASLDGKTTQSARFTGRFDGTYLTQATKGGPSFKLRFERNSRHLGPTARVDGSIGLPGQGRASISGITYANPIPPSFWGGQTYYVRGTAAGGKKTAGVKMGAKGEVFYDNGKTGSPLVRLKSYRYNLDMYYFAFTRGELIMGTASQQGLTVGAMSGDGGKIVSQRSLTTLPGIKAPTAGENNYYPRAGAGPTLGDFSGHYPIPTKKYPKAFISIERTKLVDPAAFAAERSRVLISISLDGTTVRSWYYDRNQMTFDGKTLRMPKQKITLNLERQYNQKAGTLVNVTGTVNKHPVRGASLFNEVPLSAFAGTYREASGQHELVVSPTGNVTLDGQTISNYQYLPMMYIVYGPLPGTVANRAPAYVSLGYAGANGKAAIITKDIGTPQESIFTLATIVK
jgi:hypothetical protein